MPLIATRGAASAQGFGEFAQRATAVQAEAIDYDGTNDYLSRASDLVGNTDGKTFTFSVWIWSDGQYGFILSDLNNRIYSEIFDTGNVTFWCTNTAGTTILRVTAVAAVSLRTWTNFVLSVDLANTSNRHFYVNDQVFSPSWNTYTNDIIDWTRPSWGIAARSDGGTGWIKSRLSNLFLDYTYRNLSITANRRLFVTADLKPAAGQAALNPIMYLPMSDPTAPGLNQGTGGNFTLTGVVARSGRGPNQYNAPYSDLDGSADYLSRTTAPTGIADSNTFTVHCVFTADSVSTAQKIVFFGSDASNRFQVAIDPSGQISLQGYNSSGTQLLGVTTVASIVVGRNYVLDVSVELFNPSSRHFFINGQAASVTWNVYTGGFIDFNIATTPRYHIGANTNTGSPSQFFNGRLGALWFSTDYIDLSVPANLTKFVTGTGINAAPVDLGATGQLPTGTSPLVYLPMYGNNAGLNYGTGGDFTVNSGPFPGARGPNEFWGNKIDFNGNSPRSYLSRTSALVGVSNGNVISGSFWCSFDSAGSAEDIFRISSSGNQDRLRISKNSSNQLNIRGLSTGNTSLFNVTGGTVGAGDYYIQFCFDLSDSSKRFLYINNVSATLTITTYTDGSIGLAEPNVWVGTYDASNSTMNGRLAEFYISASYIDFSQEANRLKFRDCFGNPTNLPSAITAATVPTPAIYLRFDPTSFGTNSGTGGNFTVTSTPTDGGQL